jgi:SNF2 family DNA or RNA helicase
MSSIISNINRFKWFIEKAKLNPMPHQSRAVEWMLNKEIGPTSSTSFVKGGILADEMGLGKTIMMIGLFVSNYVRKTLIVVPAPLVAQWVSEMNRTTGHNILVWSKKVPRETLEKASFVIVTYNKVAIPRNKDTKEYDLEKTNSLHKIFWDRVIFDEAHHLRNKNGNFWSGRTLKAAAKWLISGTPVQNRKEDFYNLCSVLGLPASYYTSTELRAELLQNYYLRRTKKEIGIEMPELKIIKKKVAWSSEEEKKLSQDIHSAYEDAGIEDRLKLINFARQVCTLPQMLNPKIPSLIKDRYLEKNYTSAYFQGTRSMSKIDEVIKTIIDRSKNGAGKLVFCHFRQEIDVIEERLKKEGITSVGKFDGRVGAKERNKMIKEGVEVLILQIQTGCEGINLQEHYSEVYFVSPNWNPAVEEQAIARCHRIGQQKEVNVFRFGMKNTVKLIIESNENFAGANAGVNDGSYAGAIELETQTLDNYIGSVQKMKNEVRTSFEPV